MSNDNIRSNDSYLSIKLEDMSELGHVGASLRRNGIKTVRGLRDTGVAKLVSMGYTGEKLNRIIHTLEIHGINTTELFYGKEILDERKTNILNMPMTKVFNDKKVLFLLYRNKINKIKDVLGIKINNLARILYNMGDSEAYKTAMNLMDTITEKFGVRVDQNHNILFNPRKLEEIPMLTIDDTLVIDLPLSSRAKKALIGNGVFDLYSIKKADLMSLKNLGEVNYNEIKNCIINLDKSCEDENIN